MKKRGRPRKFDPIIALRAALRVFRTRGFEGASLSELTGAMGVSRPSLYALYGSKQGLFWSALDLYEREDLAYVQAALEAPTAKAVAENLLRGALRMQSDPSQPNGCLAVVCSMPGSVEAEPIRLGVIARRAAAHSALVNRLSRAREEGDLPHRTEPEALARLLGALVQGLCVQAGCGASFDDMARAVNTAMTLLAARGLV